MDRTSEIRSSSGYAEAARRVDAGEPAMAVAA